MVVFTTEIPSPLRVRASLVARPHNPAEDKQVYGKTRPQLDQNSISTVMPREDVTASPPRASSPHAAAGRTNSPLAKHVRTGSALASEAQEKP